MEFDKVVEGRKFVMDLITNTGMRSSFKILSGFEDYLTEDLKYTAEEAKDIINLITN